MNSVSVLFRRVFPVVNICRPIVRHPPVTSTLHPGHSFNTSAQSARNPLVMTSVAPTKQNSLVLLTLPHMCSVLANVFRYRTGTVNLE